VGRPEGRRREAGGVVTGATVDEAEGCAWRWPKERRLGEAGAAADGAGGRRREADGAAARGGRRGGEGWPPVIRGGGEREKKGRGGEWRLRRERERRGEN
jgi:hypothetical protein